MEGMIYEPKVQWLMLRESNTGRRLLVNMDHVDYCDEIITESGSITLIRFSGYDGRLPVRESLGDIHGMVTERAIYNDGL
jgi:hypothetical protein